MNLTLWSGLFLGKMFFNKGYYSIKVLSCGVLYGVISYDYSIDEIAKIFYDVGFDVAVKRLPVDYPLIYNPKLTKDFSNSLLDLVDTTYENKMIFSFWKPFE